MLEKFGVVLKVTLASHPVGVSFVARLRPTILVPTTLSEGKAELGFQAFAFGHILRHRLNRSAESARKDGVHDFFLPDPSLLALMAFLGYLPYDEAIWRLSDAQSRMMAGHFCDCILATLFLGLIQDLTARPVRVDEWGEAGRALAPELPRARATLHRALSTTERRNKRFLEVYQACQWDSDQAAKRLRLTKRSVNDRCHAAVQDLAVALRWELAPPDVQ